MQIFNQLFCSRSVNTEIVEKDGFFDIFYLLEEPGSYDVDVKYGGVQVNPIARNDELGL